ncbi:hypothetical protein [Kineosporia sp. NBRC 101731]|uniref:hypothetical protein n=1 Tax=Kineosporia sp. NBRC 101731 TaxID=3032199 RepID=UPI0024A315D3|nr:hypothetical protein [Kineosporia sp. NBRC 101731]GLY32071.1 hypothetical protein Kisp02_54360 [Kineosporia sp. NBRC 101731]
MSDETQTATWLIGQGEYSDMRIHGTFTGTQHQAAELVADLEQSRRRVDYDETVTLVGDAYWYTETTVIASAADILAVSKS